MCCSDPRTGGSEEDPDAPDAERPDGERSVLLHEGASCVRHRRAEAAGQTEERLAKRRCVET